MNEPTTTVATEEQEQSKNVKHWYVIQAYAGYEKQVQQSLREYIERNDMQEYFGDILVPTEKVVEMKGGQKRTSERKFFPSYVLVQMSEIKEGESDDEAEKEIKRKIWHLVKSVPKVSGFIGGTENSPIPITNQEANEILQQISDSEDKPKVKFTFAPGELVRIIDGPFAEFNGIVEDTNFEKNKLRVSVSIFGRSTPVELDFTQVAKG